MLSSRWVAYRDYADVFLKLPRSPFVYSSIYFQHDLLKGTTVCFISGNNIGKLETRLQGIFSGPASPAQPSSSHNPLLILAAIFAEFSAILEHRRRELDVSVCVLESKTGMTAHGYSERLRAKPTEFAQVTHNLHIVAGYTLFFEQTMQAHLGALEFLRRQHDILQNLRKATPRRQDHTQRESPSGPSESEVVYCLDMSMSFSRYRLDQVRGLSRRLEIQLDVVRISSFFYAHFSMLAKNEDSSEPSCITDQKLNKSKR